jgi:hypothetical protein
MVAKIDIPYRNKGILVCAQLEISNQQLVAVSVSASVVSMLIPEF